MYHHRIWYFPVMGVKRGMECMFLKKGVMEKERGGGGGGAETPLCTMFNAV